MMADPKFSSAKFSSIVTPLDQAIAWSAQRRLDTLSLRDERLFQNWLQDADNAAAWYDVGASMDAIGAMAADDAIRDMRTMALAAVPEPSSWRRWQMPLALAASVLAVVGLTLSTKFVLPPATPAAAPAARYASKVGEQRTIMLSDSTRISLNTASIVDVSYLDDVRSVRLVAGQALFNVAKNPNRPFVVKAGGQMVTALGTSFDVNLLDKGGTAVTLVEGRVNVDPINKTANPKLHRQTLSPGQSYIVDLSGHGRVTQADTQQITGWSRGQIIFRSQRLEDAVLEMNRYSNIQISIADPRIANLRVSGVFNTGGRDDFIEAVTALHPVSARKDAPDSISLYAL
jgi:transmembrane sensor